MLVELWVFSPIFKFLTLNAFGDKKIIQNMKIIMIYIIEKLYLSTCQDNLTFKKSEKSFQCHVNL